MSHFQDFLEEERHDHGIKYASYFMLNIGAPRSVSPDRCDHQAKLSLIGYDSTSTVLVDLHPSQNTLGCVWS